MLRDGGAAIRELAPPRTVVVLCTRPGANCEHATATAGDKANIRDGDNGGTRRRASDPSTSECVNTLKGHSHLVNSVDANGTIICSGSSDGTVRVWDAAATATESKAVGHHSHVEWV